MAKVVFGVDVDGSLARAIMFGEESMPAMLGQDG